VLLKLLFYESFALSIGIYFDGYSPSIKFNFETSSMLQNREKNCFLDVKINFQTQKVRV
jgi:hypothetical protein